MNKLPFKMIDADQHFYETDDCFTRHLPRKWIDEGRAVQVIRREGEATGRVMFRRPEGNLLWRSSHPFHGAARRDAGIL